MSTTFDIRSGEVTTTMVTETCCTCGVLHGVPHYFQQERRRDHRVFYCPNGHQQVYKSPSEAETLRAQLAQKTAAMDQLEQSRRIAWQRVDEEKRKTAAAKGQMTKLKRRSAAGVCPCCNRTFKQLAAHISGQHPDFVIEHGVPVVTPQRKTR